jgi:hypothetical protein
MCVYKLYGIHHNFHHTTMILGFHISTQQKQFEQWGLHGHDFKNCLYHFKIILKNLFCTFVKRKKIILEWIPRKSMKFMCSKLCEFSTQKTNKNKIVLFKQLFWVHVIACVMCRFSFCLKEVGAPYERSIDQNLHVYKTFNFRSYFLSLLVQRDDCNKAINQHTLDFCSYLMLWQTYLRTISFNILWSPHAITCLTGVAYGIHIRIKIDTIPYWDLLRYLHVYQLIPYSTIIVPLVE